MFVPTEFPFGIKLSGYVGKDIPDIQMAEAIINSGSSIKEISSGSKLKINGITYHDNSDLHYYDIDVYVDGYNCNLYLRENFNVLNSTIPNYISYEFVDPSEYDFNKSLFFNEELMNGIKTINNHVSNIRNVLAERNKVSREIEISSFVEELRNLKSAPFDNVSINDLYKIENGILTEVKNPKHLANFETFSGTVIPFEKYNYSGNSKPKMLSTYITETANSSNPNRSDLKKNDDGKNLAYLAPQYFSPTIIHENDFDYAFCNSDVLSSAVINCYFFNSGFNHAFKNCKNLESVTFNVKYGHYKSYNGKIRHDGSASDPNFPPETFDCYGFNAGFGGYNYESYPWGNWYHGCKSDNPGKNWGNVLYKAFEGCTNLRTISFPTVYKWEVWDTLSSIGHIDGDICPVCNGTGVYRDTWCSNCNHTGHLSSVWKTEMDRFVDYFGLSSITSPLTFVFQDENITVEPLSVP